MENNYFIELNSINVGDKTEKKNGLTYLSWSWAWGEVKKRYPDATYTIYENNEGWNYFTDGRTGWVKTGATVNGIEHIEYLPIMDYKNKSIPLENITSFDVNKAIQRSLTKAIARHGLGLYIYAGEDLPENGIETIEEAKEYVLDFGKYQGTKLSEITDTNYINWLLYNDRTSPVIIKALELLGHKRMSEEDLQKKMDLMLEMKNLVQVTETDYEKLLEHFGVESDTEMTIEQLEEAKKILEKKVKKDVK